MSKTSGECLLEITELMKENPDCPVVAVVDGNIVGEDTGFWLGAWEGAHIDEILYTPKDSVIFKSDGDVFDALEKYMSAEEFDALPENESECRPYYDKLPWIKAVIVYIGMPKGVE